MKNYIQAGGNLTLPAPYDVSSGDGAKIDRIFGVASVDALSAAAINFVTRGVFRLNKVTANTFAIGAAVYWDDATKLVTSTSAGNTLIGVAVAAAGNGDGAADVRLNGSF